MGTSGELRRTAEEQTRATREQIRATREELRGTADHLSQKVEIRRGPRYFPEWLRDLASPSRARTRAVRAAEEQDLALRAAVREAMSAEASRLTETSSEKTGYAEYGEFIKDELKAQEKRKTSFEQRGLAVITTSGTLVTLLFALAALSTKEATTFTLPGAATTWLSIALVLFFVSALAALLSNAPLIYQAVPAQRIRERLREKPPRDDEAAAKDVAFSRLDALESAKKKNSIKGWALAAAMLCEALAVGCVAVAVWVIL